MELIAQNKKAWHNFFLSDEEEVGIQLSGSEVKSIRNGHISIAESYVKISKNNEMFLVNAYIKPYENASVFVPEERRNRKLLLHKNQILRFKKKVETDGFSLLPLKVYFNKSGKVKILIALGKGKKLYDKRNTLKERTIDRNLRKIK